MIQPDKWQSAVLLVGAVLMVAGGVSFSLLWHQDVTCWVYLVGAVLFTVVQSSQTYDGRSLVVRRLKRIQGLANLLFVLAGILMVDMVTHVFQPLFGTSYLSYLQLVYNKWVILLLIAALLELYTTLRMASELEKEG